MTRRDWMTRALGASCVTLTSAGLRHLSFAEDSAAAGSKDLLVTIFLRGGADGLGIVAPVDDPNYQAARGASLRVAGKGEKAGLPLREAYPGHDWRLHPAAKPLHELYEHGDLALIQACGLINGTRSHFDAQDMMERGINDQKNLGLATGWLTRTLDGLAGEALLPGVSAAGTLPVSLLGSSRAAAISSLQDFSYYGDDRQTKALRLLHEQTNPLAERGSHLLALMAAVTKRMPKKADGSIADYAPAKGVSYPETEFSQPLKTIAQLAKIEVGLQVAAVDYGDWDTHTGQEGRLNELVDNLAKTLHAFYQDISGLKQRVTVVMMSEFGRRLKANDSGGTDHGHGNLMWVLGPGIHGGKCYGAWPGLANHQLDQHADVAITTDYRQVLSEVLQARMGMSHTEAIFPGYQLGKPLGIA